MVVVEDRCVAQDKQAHDRMIERAVVEVEVGPSVDLERENESCCWC